MGCTQAYYLSKICWSCLQVVTILRVNYHYPVMLLPLSEPVPLLPGKAAKVEQVRHAADHPVPARFLHFHGPAELVLMEEGTGTFLCEDLRMPFSAGMLLFAPSMAVHDFAFDPGPRGWTLIQFDPHAVRREVIALPQRPYATVLGAEMRARLAMLGAWLAESIANEAPQIAVAAQLQALVLAAAQAIGANARDPAEGGTLAAPSALSRFRPLLNLLDRNPAQTLSLPEAATFCAMSPSYFSRRFKQAFGAGFIDYQNRLKLQLAARMLATSDEPVSQIAYRLGFRSHAYFSHCFRAEFGAPPSRYRRRI